MVTVLNVENILKLYEKNSYPLYGKENYNFNLFGIRAAENVSNNFNDVIGILFKVNGIWQLRQYAATTDPGLYYRENPCNVKGTAILKEGYYKNAFKLGYHKGKYLALVQNAPMDLYRDNNRDGVLDTDGKVYSEMAGINIHHASFTGVSNDVDKWSAGCQVIASITDWNEFIGLIKMFSAFHGEVFSYALFDERDLF